METQTRRIYHLFDALTTNRLRQRHEPQGLFDGPTLNMPPLPVPEQVSLRCYLRVFIIEM